MSATISDENNNEKSAYFKIKIIKENNELSVINKILLSRTITDVVCEIEGNDSFKIIKVELEDKTRVDRGFPFNVIKSFGYV